jgi:hypothetical protein
MALIVQKFGGTSVGDLDRIRNVANNVAKVHASGNDVVVVLSAMAGVTDQLIGMAKRITSTPQHRELDVLLATGEQTTIALLCITLESMGCPATSLLGHQAEIVTDRAFGRARIVEIHADRIRDLLAQEADQILRPLRWPLPSKQTSVKYIRTLMVCTPRIPISAPRLENLTRFPTMRCWKWRASVQRFCRSDPSNSPRNITFPYT